MYVVPWLGGAVRKIEKYFFFPCCNVFLGCCGWVGGCVSLVVRRWLCVVGSVSSKIFLSLAPFRLQTSFPVITKQKENLEKVDIRQTMFISDTISSS